MSNMPGLRELITKAQRGSESALECLVTQFAGVIRQECARYVFSLAPDLSQADLEQEVILRVISRIHQFNGAEALEHLQAAFESWIRVSARSTLSNLHRNRNAQRRSPQNGMGAFDESALDYHKHLQNQSGPSSILAKDEERERLIEAMNNRLDDRTREILTRYIVEGQTFRQICEDLSLSYDQVRYAFHKAQAELKNWLT